MSVQTSENRPITVSWILPDQLGLCFCPGKCHTRGGVKLERNLKTDLCRLKDCYNVQCIVCLLNDAELRVSTFRLCIMAHLPPCGHLLKRTVPALSPPLRTTCRSNALPSNPFTSLHHVAQSYGLRDYARTLAAHGLEYVQHAIVECAAPDDPIATCQLLEQLAQRLQRGQRMVVHCRGGVGRAGLVAACLLLRLGYAATASDAIQEVSVCNTKHSRAVFTGPTSYNAEQQRAFTEMLLLSLTSAGYDVQCTGAAASLQDCGGDTEAGGLCALVWAPRAGKQAGRAASRTTTPKPRHWSNTELTSAQLEQSSCESNPAWTPRLRCDIYHCAQLAHHLVSTSHALQPAEVAVLDGVEAGSRRDSLCSCCCVAGWSKRRVSLL